MIVAERFWSQVDITGECWLWTGHHRRLWPDQGGRQIRCGASVELRQRGKVIPDGMMLDHICHDRACVKSSHLRPVTPGRTWRTRLPHIEEFDHRGARRISTRRQVSGGGQKQREGCTGWAPTTPSKKRQKWLGSSELSCSPTMTPTSSTPEEGRQHDSLQERTDQRQVRHPLYCYIEGAGAEGASAPMLNTSAAPMPVAHRRFRPPTVGRPTSTTGAGATSAPQPTANDEVPSQREGRQHDSRILARLVQRPHRRIHRRWAGHDLPGGGEPLMGTHPLKRPSDIRPLYKGDKSRPKPRGAQHITKEDARIPGRAVRVPRRRRASGVRRVPRR